MYKKILYPIIVLLIGIVIFFYLNLDKIKKDIFFETPQLHNGIPINQILTDSNFDKVGINPNKYQKFGDFLSDLKSFSGVLIDPINEKFAISLELSGTTNMIGFDFQKDKYIFDDVINKNLAIIDIYKAYKTDSLYGGQGSKYEKRVLFDNDMDHPMTGELTYLLDTHLDKEKNVYTMISSLEKANDLGKENMEFLSYLYEFSGDYTKANEERNKICELFKNTCEKSTQLKVTGRIIDTNGNPISGSKVELLNNKEINTISDLDGKYVLEFKNSNFSHLRFRTFINGYSDGYNTISVNNISLDKMDYNYDFKLLKSDNQITISDDNYLDYKKGKYYIFLSDNSKYFVPIEGLFFEDGTKYNGNNFNIYTYLFKKDSNMDSLLENDTFEPVYGYVGNIMKTFGMPYIQFIDNNSGKELFVKSSNPMILQNQIFHMKELYENSDKIYEPLTKDDMKFLVEKSEKLGGYPIDFDFLVENKMLRWPVWWNLDRKTGLWNSIGSKVLNVDGLVELPFYHIYDKK